MGITFDQTTIMIIGIVGLLLCLIITAALFAIQSGILDPIVVKAGDPPIGAVTIAYKYVQGPYKMAGQFFSESHSLAPDFTCIGLYYDNPNKVPQEKLRFAVGKILPEDINSDPVNVATKDRLLSNGYKLMSLPKITHAVTSEFTQTTFLSLYIAIFRVYPRIADFIEEKKLCAHPMLEIYPNSETMQFMAPLSSQDDFYVEEIKAQPKTLSSIEKTTNSSKDCPETILDPVTTDTTCNEALPDTVSNSSASSEAASEVVPSNSPSEVVTTISAPDVLTNTESEVMPTNSQSSKDSGSASETSSFEDIVDVIN